MLPPRDPDSASSLRENHQRPNDSVLTPHTGGHDIPSAINSPGQPAGARSFDRTPPEGIQEARVLTCRRLPQRVCPMAGPLTLIRGASASTVIRHARHGFQVGANGRERAMAEVMIGIDPHKSSHTAVAIGPAEEPLGELRVRACASQAESCWRGRWCGRSGPGRWRAPPGWGICWPSSWSPRASRCWMCRRSWPPGCGCCRLGTTNKNDPNDALSVAVAALRSHGPAGCGRRRSRRRAEGVGETAPGSGPGPRTRPPAGCMRCSATWSLAVTEGDLRRPGRPHPRSGSPHRARLPRPAASSPPNSSPTSAAWTPSCATPTSKLAAAVKAAGTSLTGIFGVGPVIAGTVIGDVRHVSRFPSRDHFAA